MNRPGHEHCEAVIASLETQLADAKALLAKRANIRVTCHDAVLKYRERAEVLQGKAKEARISEMNAHDALACLQSDYDTVCTYLRAVVAAARPWTSDDRWDLLTIARWRRELKAALALCGVVKGGEV